MAKNLKMLNDELNELKRTLTKFTETTEKRINDLLDEVNHPLEKTCDEDLQEIINTARELSEEASPLGRRNLLFDLILSLINVYELDKDTIKGLYMQTYIRIVITYTDSSSDYLEIFENDPTELNLINFLILYCYEAEINFEDELDSALNYNNAMSVIFKLIEKGFIFPQFKMIKKNNKNSSSFINNNVYPFKESHYSDLFMIKNVTKEQLNTLKNMPEISEIYFSEENGTHLIQI